MTDDKNTQLTDAERITRLESALAEIVLANLALVSRKKLYQSPAMRQLLELRTGHVIDPADLPI
jgi:hypothetical protein